MQKVQERTGDNRNQIDIGENLLPFEFCAFLQAGTCVRPEKNQLDDDESAGIHDIFLAEQSLNQGDDERSRIAVDDVDLLHDIQSEWFLKDGIEDQKHDMRYDGTNMATDQFAITYALASGCILLCTILEYDYIYNERTSRFVNLQIAFFFFMINSGALIQTFRIIYYFMPAVVILIPEIFKKSHNKLSKGVLGTVALLAMILLFYNTYYRLNGKAAYENYQTILSSIDMIFAI